MLCRQLIVIYYCFVATACKEMSTISLCVPILIGAHQEPTPCETNAVMVSR